jgi:hypothetical protein
MDLEIVDFPAPEGEDSTNIRPRRFMGKRLCDGPAIGLAPLFKILNLLTQAVDNGFDV